PRVAGVQQMRTPRPPPAIDNFFFTTFGQNAFVGASSPEPMNVPPLSSLLNSSIQGIPGTFGFFFQAGIFPSARAGGGGLEINVVGNDINQVNGAALAVQMSTMQALGAFPSPTPMNFHLGRNETQIIPDRVRAASAGVNPVDIRAIAQTAVDGWIIGDYRDRGESIDLTLVTNQGRTGRVTEDLRHVPIPTRGGTTVPLSSVARFIDTTAPQTIRRVEEQPSVKLSVQLPAGLTLTEAAATVQSQVIEPLTAAGVLGGEISTRLSGSADKLTAFRTAFIPGFIVAAIVTYLLLAMLFESLIHPFTIIMSVPFAMVGGFVALAALHWYDPQYKLDVLTMLGFVILIGTIINSPILIVYQALNFLEQGMTRREAIARSTQTRVRPIFMSVVTSVAGLAPLVIFGGAGSELYRGLGAVLVGGLALSTFFTLFLTPMLMSLMLDLEQFIKRLIWGDPDQPSKGHPRQRDSMKQPVDEPDLVTARLAADPGNG
ncbi:MAG TPA: efflux RND transporter permease subunit, partial [Tepidisphaeraceae bacterium]|nr:efflux RND transporter permease subunit [Tepidisphaeraceae bacterium]